MVPLASTTFAGGVNEKLSAIDVCAQTGELYSGISGQASGGFNLGSLATSLGVPQLAKATPIASMTMINKMGAVALSPSGMLANVANISPSAFSAVSSGTGSFKDAITQAKGIMSAVTTTVAGVKSTVAAIKSGNVASLINTVSAIAPPGVSAFLKDNAATVAFGTNLYKQATTMGVGGVLSVIAGSPQFQGSPLLGITQNILPVIKSAGDVKAFVELAKHQGPAMLSSALAPSLGFDVLKAYKAVGATKKELVQQWGEVKQAAASLKTDLTQVKKTIKSDIAGIKSEVKTYTSSAGLKRISADAKMMIKAEVDTRATQRSAQLASKTPEQLALAIMQPPITSPEEMILPTLPSVSVALANTFTLPKKTLFNTPGVGYLNPAGLAAGLASLYSVA